jgi:cytochrome c553
MVCDVGDGHRRYVTIGLKLDCNLYDSGERQIMKTSGLQLGLRTAVLATVFATSSFAESTNTTANSKQNLQAKIEYCEMCHGLSGQGYHGYYPIPRLAGQQTEYFENQLRAFIERRRQNRYMYNVALALSPAMRTALAKHFGNLNPKPLGSAPRQLVAMGKKIYEDGVPETNVPACMACHGAEANGQEAIPRLAGQLPDYILSKLANWNKERGQGTADISAVMLPTSHNLTKSQIAAVAAYVSYLQ